MTTKFVLLTDATSGEYIMLNKSNIDRAYTDTRSSKGVDSKVTRIDFLDHKPSEWVEETVVEVYKKLNS